MSQAILVLLAYWQHEISEATFSPIHLFVHWGEGIGTFLPHMLLYV